jgi:hypothetical protein
LQVALPANKLIPRDNSMQVFTHKQEAKLANGPVAQPKRSCSSLPLIWDKNTHKMITSAGKERSI